MNWRSAGTLVFNKGLVLDVDGTFQLDSSVQFAEGSLLTVIMPASGIQSGESRKAGFRDGGEYPLSLRTPCSGKRSGTPRAGMPTAAGFTGSWTFTAD